MSAVWNRDWRSIDVLLAHEAHRSRRPRGPACATWWRSRGMGSRDITADSRARGTPPLDRALLSGSAASGAAPNPRRSNCARRRCAVRPSSWCRCGKC
jgi:hypothetical protein